MKSRRASSKSFFDSRGLASGRLLRQKTKVRPIDDYKANMATHLATQSEGVAVHTIDHVASIVAYWLKASKDRQDVQT